MTSLRLLGAVLVLLVAAALPCLSSISTLALHHHDHEPAAGRPANTSCAAVVLHGHGHPASVPDHDHRLLPSPAGARSGAAPPVTAAALPAVDRDVLPAPLRRLPGAAGTVRPLGAGPPLQTLHSVLLI